MSLIGDIVPSCRYSMDSTGDSSKRMRGGVKSEAGQKEGAAVPLQKPKKTRGRVKLEMEFIENKLKRRKTFSKRKKCIINKVKQLATLTGTQVILLVASETGHLYKFATDKLEPMFTSEAGKDLIQSCLKLKSPALDSTPPPHDDNEPTGDHVSTTAATCYKEEVDPDLTFQASESESLDNTNDESKPSFNNVTSLPGSTTTSSSSQSMLPTTSTIQESSNAQSMLPTTYTTGIQQHSQALMSSLPMDGHMMYPTRPHTVMYNTSLHEPSIIQTWHEQLMYFTQNMCAANSSLY